MIDFVALMYKPFLACLILTGIHAYLGLHVVDRGVIFVDLALAQIAALGSTVGFLMGFGLHSQSGYLVSLSFALIGAVIFSVTRHRKPIIPHEALIGVTYAVSAAASVLVLSRSAEGGEELKSLLIGHLLFVDTYEIAKIFVLYSLVGTLHWIVRKPLLVISQNPDRAFQEGVWVKWWDFVFYASFALVVTSSVEVAGVLQVFSFLIVPALCGVLLAEGIMQRLWISWLVGVVTSMAGMVVSYVYDFPTGATIVCLFGVSLVVCTLLKLFLKWKVA